MPCERRFYQTLCVVLYQWGMEMNFPHRSYQRSLTKPRLDYANLIATAAARQMAGVTARSVASGDVDGFARRDPLSSRMGYFGGNKQRLPNTVSGAFLPQKPCTSATVNINGDGVYPEHLVKSKPYLLTSASPEQPVAKRGMENRG